MRHYGHQTGDRLLAEIARKIVTQSPPGACCARIGGDEFASLLDGSDAAEGRATALAQRLLKEIERPTQLEMVMVQVSASIGLSAKSSPDESSGTLMRRSDIAMYEAKLRGRNGYTWFDVGLERELGARKSLEHEMRAGIAGSQFVPFFQPLHNAQTGELKGFEVLARWEHPTKGIMEPANFIPVAEATGMIGDLSFAIMLQALNYARGWPDHLTIAVNISPLQFRDPLLTLRIVKLLGETGVKPSRLELEITESALLDNLEQALWTVGELKAHGIRITLDDFGTGYASFTQLRSIPFDSIKIDRAFVANLLKDEQSYALIQAITTLGKNMNFLITAEGVESEEVYETLQHLGCSYAQGWLFGKAQSAEETEKRFMLIDTGPSILKKSATVENAGTERAGAGSISPEES